MGNVSCLNVRKFQTLNLLFLFAKENVDRGPLMKIKKYVPLVVNGDGSCLYRSISVLVYGDESKHLELRVR